MTEKTFRTINPKQYLASKIDQSFADQNWQQDGIDYAPTNIKNFMKDIIMNYISIDNCNLNLITATSIIVYKMLYENETSQKMFAPKSLNVYSNLNMIRSMKNTILTTYNLPLTSINESDTYFNSLPEENRKALMSMMYDFIFEKVIKALNLNFTKKEENIQNKYYTTIYRYIVYILTKL
jgi:hypothetical protein